MSSRFKKDSAQSYRAELEKQVRAYGYSLLSKTLGVLSREVPGRLGCFVAFAFLVNVGAFRNQNRVFGLLYSGMMIRNPGE